jgi:hypothetical protein
MKLEFYWAGEEQLFGVPANEGIEEALGLLSSIPHDESVLVEIVDTNELSEERIREVYSKACTPAIWKHIGIRRVFGTKRRGDGPFFGREVPALLVYEAGERHPSDVYPHQKPGKGPVVTIRDFLSAFGSPSRYRDAGGARGEGQNDD